MKNLILLFGCLVNLNGFGQKISGTVTYFYNAYQGNRADVGSSIYILDSASNNKIDVNAIDSFIVGETVYYLFLSEQKKVAQSKDDFRGSLYSKKRKEQMEYKMPENVKNNAMRYGVDSKQGFDRLDSTALRQVLMFFNYSAYKSKADGVGNYSFSIKKPGTYYVMIQSANRQSLSLTSIFGKIYLEKVTVLEDDEKNVSNNFTVY